MRKGKILFEKLHLIALWMLGALPAVGGMMAVVGAMLGALPAVGGMLAIVGAMLGALPAVAATAPSVDRVGDVSVRMAATGDYRLPKAAHVVSDVPGYNSWPKPDVLDEGFESRPHDAGNVNVTRRGTVDCCAWYTGTPSNATVVVTAVPKAEAPCAWTKDIFAPQVVGVPPTFAARDMCVTADGEIRHYGKANVGGQVRRVYVASRDGFNWTRRLAATTDVGPMVRSPWSGDWIYFNGLNPVTLVRSKIGPGDTHPEVTALPWKKLELRQILPLKSRKRWLAVFSNVECKPISGSRVECYHATVAYSDDDGRTWTRVDLKPVADVARLTAGDKRPHWFNNGCEPTFAELADGTILLAVRTSGPHAAFYRSTDGGATWGEGRPDPAFWQANTMPYFFRLKDGRLLFIWNNTAMLPTRDLKEYPELWASEGDGTWETVFTNRDALHAAISDDDGKTWKGFREIILNEIRNAADFRELGNEPHEERDKSVHQTQAVELPGGKVLLALGQNVSARRLVVFDPDWLLETARRDDFSHGLAGLSTHLYVKSLTGTWRGWAGHCAWNRMVGATLVRDPYTDHPPAGSSRSNREVLQLCRIRDPRLVSDRQGIVWNFPAARKGAVTLDCRIAGAGFRLTLADHWMNPSDETGPALSPFSQKIDCPELRAPGWHKLTVAWDFETGRAVTSVDGKSVGTTPLASLPRFGLSYLHLQTLAEETDAEGAYFRELAKE